MPTSEQPPYTPGFGLSPPILAGRDEVLDEVMGALRSGPRHPQFVSALIGHRGVGKTSVLDAIGEQVTAHLGWPVLHHQAMRDDDLLGGIVEALPGALGRWGRLGRDYRQLDKQLKVAVHLGVASAEASVTSRRAARDPGATAFRKVVHEVGAFAAAHDTGVLVTVDEASSAQPSDLAALAGVIQVEVNRGRLPVAVLFAGLPSFREAIAKAGTFAERLSVHSIEDLGADASRLALVEPAARHHVRWEPAALDLVVTASGGHPYHVQLFGYHTWKQAEDADELTAADARAGVRTGIANLHGQFATTWSRLRPLDQAFLSAAARLSGDQAVSVAAVAAAIGRTPAQLDPARHRLVHTHGLLRAPRRGEVQYRTAHLASWVRDTHPDVKPDTAIGGEVRYESATGGPDVAQALAVQAGRTPVAGRQPPPARKAPPITCTKDRAQMLRAQQQRHQPPARGFGR